MDPRRAKPPRTTPTRTPLAHHGLLGLPGPMISADALCSKSGLPLRWLHTAQGQVHDDPNESPATGTSGESAEDLEPQERGQRFEKGRDRGVLPLFLRTRPHKPRTIPLVRPPSHLPVHHVPLQTTDGKPLSSATTAPPSRASPTRPLTQLSTRHHPKANAPPPSPQTTGTPTRGGASGCFPFLARSAMLPPGWVNWSQSQGQTETSSWCRRTAKTQPATASRSP